MLGTTKTMSSFYHTNGLFRTRLGYMRGQRNLGLMVDKTVSIFLGRNEAAAGDLGTCNSSLWPDITGVWLAVFEVII